MPDVTPIQGDLQAQIMAAIWRIEEGTVEHVRSALPPRYRSAYTTVQTVLNRLVERGFLARTRGGPAIVYRPKLSEAEYLYTTIHRTLASASADARQAALVQLIGGLQDGELADLKRLAEDVDDARRRKQR